MNVILYALTVLIWGTTWIAIALQTGEVPAMVSVFYRFAIASLLLWAGLLWLGRLRPLTQKDHIFCVLQGMCVFCFNFLCFWVSD